MTQSDQDRTIGQARREYRQAKHDLAVLKLRARQIGEHFSGICTLLINEPHNLIFHGQPASGPDSRIFNDGEFSAFTPEALRTLTQEIREATARVATLRQYFLDMDNEVF